MKRTIFAAVAAGFVAGGASAATFDFEEYADSTAFTNTDSVVRPGGEGGWDGIVGGAGVGILDVGTGISVIGSASNSAGGAAYAYFDSNSAGLGVCGVLNAGNQCATANDDNVGAIGGSAFAGNGTFEVLTLTFSEAVKMTQLVFAAEGHGAFTGSLLINSVLTMVTGGTLNTALTGTTFDFQYVPVASTEGSTNEFYIDAVTVEVDDGGELGGEVPLPAGLPLLLAGLGAFGIAKRRQRG